nr:uncharacterized protein LOC123759298 [Procambarus clarkii]XP_045600123.1 uncharacterized protein LOC123759298 [Procambarus clarkii]XP_045600124.1 uncharacterized protein LOC123759298 [Procambarus clarkii]
MRTEDMEDAGSCSELLRNIADEWATEAATVQFAWDVIGQAGNVSLDVARHILASYRAKCSGKRRHVGGYIQCPKCSTPRIAGFCKPRLLGCPRNARNMKTLLKKERKNPRKLTCTEKMKLSCFHSRQNIIEVSCLICKYKMRELCSVPVKEKPIVEVKSEVIRKKKKKKKFKEVNAGLHLSSSEVQSKASKVPEAAPAASKLSSTLPTQEEALKIVSSVGNLRLKNKKLHGKFVKNNFDQSKSSDLSSTDQKILSERVKKSIVKSSQTSLSSSAADFKSNFMIGSRPRSRPGSWWEKSNIKEEREKQKKLCGLKNAVLKDMHKHNSDDKKSSLGDFLASLI